MNIEDDILIAQYFRGELSENDLVHFEDRMNSDSDFKEKVNLEGQLFKSLGENRWNFIENSDASKVSDYKTIINNQTTNKLKDTLKEVDADYKIENKRKFNRTWLITTIAASLIIFLAINVFVNSNVSNEELYYEYINESSLPSFIDRSTNSNVGLIKGQKLFEAKSYKEAQIIFEKTLDSINDNATLYLYTGISQMGLNEFSKAEITFNKLISSNLLDAEKGYWYKSLLYLKMDNIEAAKKELNTIISKSLFNTKQAILLLEDLD